ncbi:hypothetical protein, partial [Neorhizobium galegae]|uniref:hypothetical protein n=1 Tax=Neorhizobium galegae TaxID=399 RepID=UPI0020352E84
GHSLRSPLITWVGITGGALTLLSNLQGLLDLARWAEWLVGMWRAAITLVITTLVELTGVKVTGVAASMIAMAIFVSLIAIGARLEDQVKGAKGESSPVRRANVFNMRVLIAVGLYVLQVGLVSLAGYLPWLIDNDPFVTYTFIGLCYLLYCGAIVVGLKGWPLWSALIVAGSMIGFSFVFGQANYAGQPNLSEPVSTAIAGAFAIVCGLIVVAIAPPVTFTRRVIFLSLGVAFVVALSELSQMGLSLVPRVAAS